MYRVIYEKHTNKQNRQRNRSEPHLRPGVLAGGRGLPVPGTQAGRLEQTGKCFGRKDKLLTAILSKHKGWGLRWSFCFSSVWWLFL